MLYVLDVMGAWLTCVGTAASSHGGSESAPGGAGGLALPAPRAVRLFWLPCQVGGGHGWKHFKPLAGPQDRQDLVCKAVDLLLCLSW